MSISIEIGYATSSKQMLISLSISDGSVVEDAITQSNILNHFPDIDLSRQKVGIFGKIVSLSQPLFHGDRVEIYRSLIIDPKQARKKRAKHHDS